MGCPCKNKRRTETASAANPAKEQEAPSVKLEFTVRGTGHPFACEDCLGKHVGAAFVLAAEYAEDKERKTERLLCLSNLRCAKDHSDALGKQSLSELLDEAFSEFAFRGNTERIADAVDELCGVDAKKRARMVAVGHLAAAEQDMRLCGGDAFADRVRSIRLDWGGGA